jgi:hypothetical protein
MRVFGVVLQVAGKSAIGRAGAPQRHCDVGHARIALAICWVFAMSGGSEGIFGETLILAVPAQRRLTDWVVSISQSCSASVQRANPEGYTRKHVES